MEMGDFNHSLSRRNGNLIIFAETSGMVEPGEGTFDHPSPRELFPLQWCYLFPLFIGQISGIPLSSFSSMLLFYHSLICL